METEKTEKIQLSSGDFKKVDGNQCKGPSVLVGTPFKLSLFGKQYKIIAGENENSTVVKELKVKPGADDTPKTDQLVQQNDGQNSDNNDEVDETASEFTQTVSISQSSARKEEEKSFADLEFSQVKMDAPIWKRKNHCDSEIKQKIGDIFASQVNVESTLS